MKKIILLFIFFPYLVFADDFLMFRGNPERTMTAKGEIPLNISIEWKYPEKPMCAKSSAYHKTKNWCGTGWTGQTLVRELKDGAREIIFGAYDKAFHFVDSVTGLDTKEPFYTGDILKGSATLDPDNFPLLYGGSRDNVFRILALDRGSKAKKLWSMNAYNVKGIWNDDWDSNPIIKNDYLFVGGENGWLYVIKLNRSYNNDGLVIVNPKMVWKQATFDKKFLKLLGDRQVGIENSIYMKGDIFYVANSGGRVLGYDISKLENEGAVSKVFDFWAGDDIDGSIIGDENGNIYVSIEDERKNERSKEIGQLIKLNPSNKENPLVWSKFLPSSKTLLGGIWATPVIKNGVLYTPTNRGKLLAIDTITGETIDEYFLGGHDWSSPVIASDRLLQATCHGALITFDISQKKLEKIEEFKFKSGTCIEATPTVVNNEIYIGNRDGFMYKLVSGE